MEIRMVEGLKRKSAPASKPAPIPDIKNLRPEIALAVKRQKMSRVATVYPTSQLGVSWLDKIQKMAATTPTRRSSENKPDIRQIKFAVRALAIILPRVAANAIISGTRKTLMISASRNG